MSNKHHDILGVPKYANQHRLSRLTMEVHTDELRLMASAVESYTDELIAALEAADKRNAELEDILDTEIKSWMQRYDSANNRREAAEKRIAELPGKKRLIGWRMADYTDETADPALAKNWATAVDVLPIFEGDVNTKLSAAAAGKGEAS